MKDKVCKSCGFVGKPVHQSWESFLVDLLLWFIFFNLTFLTGLFPLMLIPLVWTIVHLARFRSVKCPKCQNYEMVSINSHAGQEQMAKLQRQS